MTNRQAHDNPEAGRALIAELISPAPEDFIQRQYDVIFGDADGTFEDKYAEHEMDEQVNGRALQADLTRDLAEWEARKSD